MLKNDEVFWMPTEMDNAAYRSWGGSEGDFAKLWEHSVARWQWIRHQLSRIGVSAPRGKVIEFGSGMGLLDDLSTTAVHASSCSIIVTPIFARGLVR